MEKIAKQLKATFLNKKKGLLSNPFFIIYWRMAKKTN